MRLLTYHRPVPFLLIELPTWCAGLLPPYTFRLLPVTTTTISAVTGRLAHLLRSAVTSCHLLCCCCPTLPHHERSPQLLIIPLLCIALYLPTISTCRTAPFIYLPYLPPCRDIAWACACPLAPTCACSCPPRLSLDPVCKLAFYYPCLIYPTHTACFSLRIPLVPHHACITPFAFAPGTHLPVAQGFTVVYMPCLTRLLPVTLRWDLRLFYWFIRFSRTNIRLRFATFTYVALQLWFVAL